MRNMLIGQLANELGIRPETIRLYESRGLLPEPQRAPNGYRKYDEATTTRLRFIRTAQTAGLTLAEIGGVLAIRDAGTEPCNHVDRLLETKLSQIQKQRRQLAALEKDLKNLLHRSRHLNPADCTENDICQILNPTR